jgi:hypothetical protein
MNWKFLKGMSGLEPYVPWQQIEKKSPSLFNSTTTLSFLCMGLKGGSVLSQDFRFVDVAFLPKCFVASSFGCLLMFCKVLPCFSPSLVNSFASELV